MRIATFNVEDLGPSDRTDDALTARLPALRAVLEKLDADVLCLQEINAAHVPGHGARQPIGLARLIEATRYADFALAVSVRDDTHAPADRHNLAILSRWPIERTQQLWNDLVPPLPYRYATAAPAVATEIRWDRPALCAVIRPPDGRPLHVINAHLRAPLAVPVPGLKRSADRWTSTEGFAEGLYLAALKRAGQALELRRHVDRLFADEPEARIILAGDFNADPHEIPLRLLRCDPAELGHDGLADRALRLLAPTGAAPAFSVVHDGRRLWVDHILASAALAARCRGLEVGNSGLADSAGPDAGRSVASHHAPVVAAFDL